MNRPPCHYCEGSGYGEERIDVDDFRPVRCDLCEGTGEAMHSANTYTGPKRQVYGFGGTWACGDLLEVVSRFRKSYLAGKRSGSWRVASLKSNYELARLMAVRPVSGLASAEFRAMCTRVGTSASNMSATVRATNAQLFGRAA